jgi:hypothetical protein
VLDTASKADQESLECRGSGVKTESPTATWPTANRGTFTKLSGSHGYNITTASHERAKTINVSYTSLDMIDAKIAKEVVYTLTLK